MSYLFFLLILLLRLYRIVSLKYAEAGCMRFSFYLYKDYLAYNCYIYYIICEKNFPIYNILIL